MTSKELIWLLLAFAGCKTQANARYCDANTACPSTFPFCDLDRNECTAVPPADAAVPLDLSAEVDLAVEDAAEGDAADAASDQGPPACTVPADCPSPAPICDPGGSCRACNGAADDGECAVRSAAAPRCRLLGATAGQCVQCNTPGDCPSPSPVCDPSGTCVKCTQHSECPSGICILDDASAGMCADPFDVAWVDNGGESVAKCKQSGIHDGAPAHPYCDIIDAINSGHPFVRVIGHLGAPYTPMSFTTSADGNVTIVGPGVDVAQPATLFDGNNTGFGVTVNGGATANIKVVLDGIEIGDRTTLSNQTGLYCNNGGSGTVSFVLRRGAVRNQNSSGVSATNCKLEISDSVLSKNNNIGVAMAGSIATLTNDTLTDNAGTAAVNCANNGGTLGQLTLTGNTITSQAGIGVNFANSDLTATGNTISSNSGAGAVCQASFGGTSTWNGNTISGNGGGGLVSNCPITAAGNTLSSNTGAAGVTLANTNATLTSNVITGNAVAGVSCSNGTTVLTNNTIGRNADLGVVGNAGTLTLDGNTIFGSTGGGNNDGVNVFNSNLFTMTNNFIFSNAHNGVTISSSSTGKFIFNTVVFNGGAGVDCGSTATLKPIEASIVWGNQQTAGTQFPNTSCELLTTVTGVDSFPGALQLDPQFVHPSPLPSPFDYHLKKADAANAVCCYDKIGGPLDGGTSPLPDHDVDGEHRPLGGGYDVGADEAQ